MALTTEQRTAFRERGYFTLGRVFDAGEIDELSAAYDAALAHPLKLGERPIDLGALLARATARRGT
jgi:hypothetical protein